MLAAGRGRRLYLARAWCADAARRQRARVPDDVEFATKTGQGTSMVNAVIAGGVPFAFLAGNEVYGRSSKLRAACEKHGKGYVLAVPVTFTVTLPLRAEDGRGVPGQDGAGPLLGDALLGEQIPTPPCRSRVGGGRIYRCAWRLGT